MYKASLVLLSYLILSCSNAPSQPGLAAPAQEEGGGKLRHFAGPVSNGMKGDSLFFDVSADGRKLQNLTFKGYWRCSGKLEQTTVGPEGSFTIKDGKVKGAISEPPGGGSTSWRFELNASVQKSTASGTFRMNINNLGCDTYELKWTATGK